VNLLDTLTVSGAALMKTTLAVTGDTFLNGALCVSGAATVKATLTVSGASTLKTTLSVGGAVSIGGALNLLDALTVSGATTMKSTLTIAGATHCKTTLSVGGVMTFGGAQFTTVKYACFSGTSGTVVSPLKNQGISTVSRSASGIYKLTFSVAFADANYVTQVTPFYGTGAGMTVQVLSQATGSVKVMSNIASGNTEPLRLNVFCFE